MYKNTKKKLGKNYVRSNLLYIKTNFKVLSDSNLKLQKKKKNIPLFESLDILQKVQEQLLMAQGNGGQKVFKKFETVLYKNSELEILKKYQKYMVERVLIWQVYLKFLQVCSNYIS